MPDTDDAAGLAGFASLRAEFAKQHLAVFLDVDGTLLDIARRPDAVWVPPALREALRALAAHNGGAVALVSGRSLADLDGLFAPLHLPAAGLHGIERRDAAGIIHAGDHSADLDDVRRFLSESADKRVLIEDKGSALVLHFREASSLAGYCAALARTAARRGHGEWQVLPGKMSYEIRRSGIGKSDAIEAFLRESPFAGRRPAFFGDDVTDEDGFAAVNARGGWSVLVGPPRATCARERLDSPAAVGRLLQALVDAAGA